MPGVAFGMERIHEMVRTYREATAEELIRRVYDRVIEFSQGTPQLDDLTAVVVKKT